MGVADLPVSDSDILFSLKALSRQFDIFVCFCECGWGQITEPTTQVEQCLESLPA